MIQVSELFTKYIFYDIIIIIMPNRITEYRIERSAKKVETTLNYADRLVSLELAENDALKKTSLVCGRAALALAGVRPARAVVLETSPELYDRIRQDPVLQTYPAGPDHYTHPSMVLSRRQNGPLAVTILPSTSPDWETELAISEQTENGWRFLSPSGVAHRTLHTEQPGFRAARDLAHIERYYRDQDEKVL